MKPRCKYSGLRKLVLPLLVLLLSLITWLPGIMPAQATATAACTSASAPHLAQDPAQAENYRKLAATKRRAAENVPAKRDCYLAWARYYDCLAARSEAGDDRDCGARPPDC